jgi:uncharacterized protein with HEPN domain
MSKTDSVRIRHMLDAAREAFGHVRGHTRADLAKHRLLNLALVRLLEIVGEAARKVSEETRVLHPEVPWQDIAGLRNRLIHGYDEIDLDIVWLVVSEEVPPLIQKLEAILDQLDRR